MAVERGCDACGVSFIARRESARFCSDACRKRAKRSGTGSVLPSERSEGDGPMVEAVRERLERLRPQDGSVAMSALLLARRLDHAVGSAESGSSVAALNRELMSVLDRAAAAQATADTVDELTERRKARQREAS